MTDEYTPSAPTDESKAQSSRRADRNRTRRSDSERIQHALGTLESLGVTLEYCNGDVGRFSFPAENGTISLNVGDPRVCKAACALLQNQLGEIVPRRIVQEALDLLQGKQILKATDEQLSRPTELTKVQQAVLGFMNGKDRWSGETEVLNTKLVDNRKKYNYPIIITQVLSRRLKESAKVFEQFGLVVELGRRSNGSHIVLEWSDASDASEVSDASAYSDEEREALEAMATSYIQDNELEKH